MLVGFFLKKGGPPPGGGEEEKEGEREGGKGGGGGGGCTPKYSEKTLSQCRCAHHKFHYNWPGNRNPAARSFFRCSALIRNLQEFVIYLTTLAVADLQGVECLDG